MAAAEPKRPHPGVLAQGRDYLLFTDNDMLHNRVEFILANPDQSSPIAAMKVGVYRRHGEPATVITTIAPRKGIDTAQHPVFDQSRMIYPNHLDSAGEYKREFVEGLGAASHMHYAREGIEGILKAVPEKLQAAYAQFKQLATSPESQLLSSPPARQKTLLAPLVKELDRGTGMGSPAAG